MIGSPLQLTRYFVTECHVTASKQFKPKDRMILDGQLLEVEPVCKILANSRHWEVAVRVKFQPGPEANTPYFFTLEVVGFFQVLPNFPEEKLKPLVQTNGPSVLYGIAREVVRDVTGRGPYPQVFLPSVSFTPPKSQAGSDPSTAEASEPMTHSRTRNRPVRSTGTKR